MSSNNSKKPMVPGAREAMNKFKMEAASDLGVSFSYKSDPLYWVFIFLIYPLFLLPAILQALR